MRSIKDRLVRYFNVLSKRIIEKLHSNDLVVRLSAIDPNIQLAIAGVCGPAIGGMFTLGIPGVIFGTFLAIPFSVICVGVLTYDKTKQINKSSINSPAIRENIYTRLGSQASRFSDEEHIDYFHLYDLVHRVDLLEYSSGNFYSIRHIKGQNSRKELSSFLLYVEHSEKKCTFQEANVRAFTFTERDNLIVKSCDDVDRKSFRHAFKIFFQKPLQQGEEFDIVYTIRLPGELAELSDETEIMSVFLGRASLGVKRLIFDVCIGFKPRAIVPSCEGLDRMPAATDGAVSAAVIYEPEEWYEKELGIVWPVPAWRMRWVVDDPKNAFYGIQYTR